ncbi:MAG: ATP-dependent DNA helicase RecG [Candidatus Paceibacterota bacterium]
MKLKTSLKNIKGIGEKTFINFKNIGLETAEDILYYFPNRYEDFSTIKNIEELKGDEEVTIKATVSKIYTKNLFRKGISITKALVSDNTGSIEVTWFNQKYIEKTLKKGGVFFFAGKTSTYQNKLQFVNPNFEEYKEEGGVKGKIIPVYSETKGINSKKINKIIKSIIKNTSLDEWLPEETIKENKLWEINKSIKAIHSPKNIKDAKKAEKRFSFEKLFLINIKNLYKKEKLKKEKTFKINKDEEYIKELIKTLPFSLTKSQNKVLKEIINDLNKDYPMNRFLQGDVGSGKTIVVFLASMLAAKEGFQVAFMVPTEILAKQHYESFKEMFNFYEDWLSLLTSSYSKTYYGNGVESSYGKNRLLNEINSGKTKIVIGTHALIQKKVDFKNLGFVIIDEQHRFGIKQRKKLLEKGKDKKRPHSLNLSATPIPRTLNLTMFGNLDISLIKEMPADRKQIKTRLVSPDKRIEAYKFIKRHVKLGRQVFVICPRIGYEDIDNKWDEIKTVKDEYEKLKNKIFPDLEISILHGKMPSIQKEDVMKNFKDHKSDILVSTSVIEVGIDMPNANIMMIEGADRFGLAQIHQFRGRVGRGKHQSFCLLFTDSSSEKSIERLKSIEKATDGFELAEKDLEIRGPGEFLGSKQSGLPDIVMKSLKNEKLVKNTYNSAKKIIKNDPNLNSHKKLKNKIKRLTAKKD